MSKRTVQRYCALFGVQPYRPTGFTLSTNLFFLKKVRDFIVRIETFVEHDNTTATPFS